MSLLLHLLLASLSLASLSLASPDAPVFPHFRGQARQVVFHDRAADQALPCVSEGFFIHPKNCSQFYRCVDYLGSGVVFSRYLFHCPTGHVFITVKDTCVPGICSDRTDTHSSAPSPPPQDPINKPLQNPVPVPPTGTPNQEILSIEFTTPMAHPSSTTTPIPSSTTSTAPVHHFSTTTTEPPFSTTITDPPSSTTTPVPSSTPTTSPQAVVVQVCAQGRYQQHYRYCNVYHPCGNPQLNYACDIGSAFDFPRQMCRIDSDGSLCLEKDVLIFNTLYSGPGARWAQETYPSNTQPLQGGFFNPQVSPMFFQV